MIRVRRFPDGYRLLLARRHTHHGALGLVLIAVGSVLVAHDWPDRRVWIADLLQQPVWEFGG